MRTYKKLLLLFLMCCTGSIAMAQEITGEVFDKESNEPVIGASISLEGRSGIGTVSDINGHFSLKIPEATGTIRIQYIGYKPKLIKIVSGTAHYRITMDVDATVLEDVVIVGYGTQKKENLTGAVSTVDVRKTMESKPLTDVAKALQGTVPGLTITAQNGELSKASDIYIRGKGSINGSGKPLILVDNVETDITLVNPEDIENISVLKDAASSSIFGARAAFGVILITTKKGKANERFTVSYNNNFAWSTPTVQPEFPQSASDEVRINIAARERVGGGSSYELFGMQGDEWLNKLTAWEAQYGKGEGLGREMVYGRDFEIINGKANFYRVWDPYKEIQNEWAPMQNHHVSISGGGEKTSFSLSASYSKQNGLIKINTDNLQKYNITANVNSAVKKWLDVGFSTLMSKKDMQYPNESAYGLWQYMFRFPAFFPFGTYEDKEWRHSAGFLHSANMSQYLENYNRITFSATGKIMPEWIVKADYTYGTNYGQRHETGGKVYVWDFWSNNVPYQNVASAALDRTFYRDTKYETNTFNVYTQYEKTFNNDHYMKAMIGANTETEEYWSNYSERRQLLDPNRGELSLATGDQFVYNSGYPNAHNDWAVAGFFGRLNYTWKSKLLAEFNLRRDGSSRFPANDQWAWFPSGSLGYRLTEEAFMLPAKKILTDLKLRGSYGTIGNQDVGSSTTFLPVMNNTTVNWINGTTLAATFQNPAAISSSLSWETVKTLDFGLDARFFNGILGATFDWYQRDTEGMLAPGKVLPYEFGATSPKENAGDFRTRGWELAIDANHQFENGLQIYGTFTLSDYQTEITKWDNPDKKLNQNYVGKKLGEIWGFETERYFTENDDMDEVNNVTQKLLRKGNFKFGPGDIKYKNLDGDPDGVINWGNLTLDDHGDIKVIGNVNPRYEYGFRLGGSWKGFDLDVYWQGVAKRSFWGKGNVAIPYYRNELMYQHQMDFWTPENPNAKYPNPYSGNGDATTTDLSIEGGAGTYSGINNFWPQTKYLLNMSYLRLKNITFGYTLPKTLTRKASIEKLRLYFSGQNLFEFSNVGVPIDPEVTTEGSAQSFIGRTYPYSRTVSFGLQLSF